MEKQSDAEYIHSLMSDIERYGINCDSLVQSGEIPVFEKYDSYIPSSLLRKAYAADKLRSDEAENAIKSIYEEIEKNIWYLICVLYNLYKKTVLDKDRKTPIPDFLYTRYGSFL